MNHDAPDAICPLLQKPKTRITRSTSQRARCEEVWQAPATGDRSVFCGRWHQTTLRLACSKNPPPGSSQQPGGRTLAKGEASPNAEPWSSRARRIVHSRCRQEPRSVQRARFFLGSSHIKKYPSSSSGQPCFREKARHRCFVALAPYLLAGPNHPGRASRRPRPRGTAVVLCSNQSPRTFRPPKQN